MMQYLNDLRSIFLEGPEVCQNEAACDQDYQHDDELEEGVQGIGKNLCCSQAQGLYQNHTLPKPEARSAQSNPCL